MLSVETKQRRIGKITSSIVGACLGYDPNKTPRQAKDEIIGGSSFAGSKATERGQRLERECVAYGADVLGACRIERPPYIECADGTGWAGDSCDALYISSDGALLGAAEAKTVALGVRDAWGEPGTDEVPSKTYLQACWHLIHWPQAPVCLVPVLFGGWEFQFEHYIVRRDDVALRGLFERMRDWHRRYILGNETPPVTADDDDWLRKRYPRANDQWLAPTPEIDSLVMRVSVAQETAKLASKVRGELRNQLRDALGHHCGVRGDNYTVTYTNNRDTLVIDWETIARELGAKEDLIRKHSVIRAGARPLNVKATQGALR